MADEFIKELFRLEAKEEQEASWCEDCSKRYYCNIKEMVAFEERMLDFGSRKYVTVTANCSLKKIKTAKPRQINVIDMWKDYRGEWR